MDGDDAFEVGWLSKIEWLRRLLNDQYLTGLPIIKELLQNADDAGATRLEIALVPKGTRGGGDNLQNPLFAGPALLVVNDGRFTDDNAVSIRQLGLSNKPGEQGAIGRFGLGLKSVFHLCEAIFYFSNDRPPRMLNPWSGSGEHANWSLVDQQHHEHMRSQVVRVMDSEQWFGLWLPLRSQSHASSFGFIKRDFLLDECPDVMRTLFPPATGWELSRILPMLRFVRHVRLWEFGRSPEPIVSIASTAGRQFTGVIDRTEMTPLRGDIEVFTTDTSAVTRTFSGIEHQVLLDAMKPLSHLFHGNHWPMNSGVRANGTYFHEKAKALAHGAAYFSADRDCDSGKVRGTWAVFLPIESRLELDGRWPGSTDVNLTLHGYFFVDAGRRHVQFADETTAVDSEESLQKEWNRCLRDEIVLPLVIPAFAQFVADSGYSPSDTSDLTKAIQDSEFFQQHRKDICRAEQFVPMLERAGVGWRRVAARPLFALPSPPVSRPDVAWEVFPALGETQECIVAAGFPALSQDSHDSDWPVGMVHLLSDAPLGSVAADAGCFEYFVESWQFVTQKSNATDPKRVILREVVRRLFAEVPFSQLFDKAETIKRLLSCLRPHDCVGIPTPNNSLPAFGVLQSMYRLRLSALLIPDSLLPDTFGACGQLSPPDARLILQVLDKGPSETTPGSNYFLWRSKAACCVFAKLTRDRDTIRNVYANHRWFLTVRDSANEVKGVLSSIHECLDASAHDLLFVSTSRKNEWACELQMALEDRQVLIIDPHVAELLAPEYDGRQLTVDELVRTLRSCPALAEPAKRVKLLRRLVNSCDESLLAKPEYRVAVRYLLHGRPDARDEDQDLLAKPDAAIEPVWSKLMDQLREASDATSRVVNPILAEQINNPKRIVLGLSLIGKSSIPSEIRRLGAERINCDSLTDEDVHILLRQMDDSDDDVLRGLRIHRIADGPERIAIQDNCYWTDGSFLVTDNRLLKQIHLLQRSNDPMTAARQHRLRPAVWSPEAAIEIVAAQPAPSIHFSTVLDALCHPGDNHRFARYQQVMLFRWLPTRDGSAVCPREVIHWPEYGGDLDKLLSHGCTVVPSSRLHAKVEQDSRWKQISKEILPSRVEALRMLGQAMAAQENFRIGPIANGDFDVVVFLRAFRDASHVMPVWKVVDRIPSKWTEQLSQFVQPLLAPIGIERLTEILNYLAQAAQASDEQDTKESCRIAYLWYLRAAVRGEDFENTVLPRIALLNRRGRWKPAAELSVGAFGIDGANVLCDEHLAILRSKVIANDRARSQNDGSMKDGHSGNALGPAEVATQIDEGAEQIIALCRRLETLAPPAAIGGLLCILGDHPRIGEVAQEYIGQVSPRTFRAKVDWKHGEKPRGPFSSIADAIGKHRYLFEVSRDRTVPILNLLGQEFDAIVHTDFSHLLLGRISLVAGNDGLVRWTRRIRFRDVIHEQLVGRDCSQLLFETTARLLEDVFEQHDRGVVDEMWSDLLKTDQIDVRIAEEYILDSAFTYLATVMGNDVNERLFEIWKRWDKARRQKVESDIAGHNRQAWLQDAEAQSRKARDDLRQLLTEDAATQYEVLDAIRHKINNQYQYTIGSVLFELFQNADDAAVELNDLFESSEPVSDSATHIAVQMARGSVRVLHWGRPINKFMSHALSEDRGRALGYDQDLEKMLMLARSDKSNRVGGRQRTGKFGLGFKSVFLLCDAPRVLSGRLAFEVIGGFLPRRLDDADRQHMVQVCQELEREDAGVSPEGTLIDLSLKSDANATEIIQRFYQLVGYLLVFARQIKTCRIDRIGYPTEIIAWLPDHTFDDGVFEVGQIRRSEASEVPAVTLFAVRAKAFTLLFATGPMGFVPLPPDVPTIWVTAPTQEHLRTGFAINAPFDVDPGRASVVEISPRNQDLAHAQGTQLAGILALLNRRTETEPGWIELRDALGLNTSCERYDFWDSLWDIAAAGFQQAASGTDDVACDLIRRTMWGGSEVGLANLYKERKTIPSKLDVDGYRALATSGTITHLLSGCLDDDAELLNVVVRWSSFCDHVRPGRVISQSRVWKVLRDLSPSLCSESLATIDLSTVLDWERELANTIDVEQAQRIGRVVNRELLERLRTGHGPARTEANRVDELLATLEFIACDGRYHPSCQLLIGIECEERPDEERMRAAFAPDERVMSDGYTGDALRLFLACRQQMTATLQDMVTWALAADTQAKRQGVLDYLHHGEYGLQLAAYLRARGLVGTWLADQQFVPGATSNAGSSPIFSAVTAILGGGGAVPPDAGEEMDDETPETESTPHLDASVVLPAIWEWWAVEGDALSADYNADLYPRELEPHISAVDPADDIAARKSWLVLFIRGMLETIGRTRAEQHRSFLQLCDERRWLDQLVSIERPSQAFLESVEAYIDDQRHTINIDYFHWLRQFLGLATVACHLDVYSRAFLDIDRFDGDFALDHVLRPRTNPAYRGTDMDAPPLDPALGIGVCFVVRELVRGGVLTRNHHAHKYCFVPVKGVRDVFIRMGCADLQREQGNPWLGSQMIYRFILDHFEGDVVKASFHTGFDLPFYLLGSRHDLQLRVLGEELF